jgi:hypothetical protein
MFFSKTLLPKLSKHMQNSSAKHSLTISIQDTNPRKQKLQKKFEKTMKSFNQEKKLGGNISKTITAKKKAITRLVSSTEDTAPPSKMAKIGTFSPTTMIAPCIPFFLYQINLITKILRSNTCRKFDINV